MMKGRTSAALLACMIGLAGCAGPAQVLFDNSIVVDHLDGNYERLASCTYEHLARRMVPPTPVDFPGVASAAASWLTTCLGNMGRYLSSVFSALTFAVPGLLLSDWAFVAGVVFLAGCCGRDSFFGVGSFLAAARRSGVVVFCMLL